jgi:predicted nucleotidyltransferase
MAGMSEVSAPDPLVARAAVALRTAFADGLVAAFAFGSHAEGRAHRESDLDIGVLLAHERFPTQRERFARRIEIAAGLASALGVQEVDVVVLNDAPPTFARRIVLDGVQVFCADAERARAFVRDVQLRAADLEPFLKRTRALKLAAIAPR